MLQLKYHFPLTVYTCVCLTHVILNEILNEYQSISKSCQKECYNTNCCDKLFNSFKIRK